MAGRPKMALKDKKHRLSLYVKSEHIPLIQAYAKKLDEVILDLPEEKPEPGIVQKVHRVPTETIVEKPKFGKDPIEFLKEKGIKPELDWVNHSKDKCEEVKPIETIDTIAWQNSHYMVELDRGVMYEMDGYGFPEQAEEIQRKYPALWIKAYNAKKNKLTDDYNMAMTEIWEAIGYV